jgi:hypothetical protein
MRRFENLLAVALVSGVLALSCSGKKNDKVSVVMSPDNQRQLSLPKGWKETHKLHDKADIQAADTSNEMYIFVLSEKKEDFRDMDIKRYSESTREAFAKSLTAAEVTGPKTLIINGQPAIQYEIRGITQNLPIVYLHTIVETPRHFSQIMAWTLKGLWEKNQETLQAVVVSFKDFSPPAPPASTALTASPGDR